MVMIQVKHGSDAAKQDIRCNNNSRSSKGRRYMTWQLIKTSCRCMLQIYRGFPASTKNCAVNFIIYRVYVIRLPLKKESGDINNTSR